MTLLFALARAIHLASLMTVFGASTLLFLARGIGVSGAELRKPLAIAALAALVSGFVVLCFVGGEMKGDLGAGFDMQVVATVRIPGGPDCMDITPDGKELWVTQRFLRRIAIVDLATMKVSGSIPTGKSPHGVFILKAPALTPPPFRAASNEPDPK